MCVPGGSSHYRDTFSHTQSLQPYWALQPYDSPSVFKVDDAGCRFDGIQNIVESFLRFYTETETTVASMLSNYNGDRKAATTLIPPLKKIREKAVALAALTKGKHWSAPLWLYSIDHVMSATSTPCQCCAVLSHISSSEAPDSTRGLLLIPSLLTCPLCTHARTVIILLTNCTYIDMIMFDIIDLRILQ
jgi:hypothetical protein